MSLPVLLIADDDKNMRIMLSCMFESSYRIVMAADGAEVLHAVETHRPDVVLVDLILPDMSGIELIAPIHARAPGLPIVLLTGLARKETADEALAAGAFDYILKPLDDFQDLEDVLARAVAVRRGA